MSHMSDDVRHATFTFRTSNLTFQMEGPETTVENAVAAYAALLASRLPKRAGAVAPPAHHTPHGLAVTAEAPETDKPAPKSSTREEDLRAWYRERVTMPKGRRGLQQDHVLLFTYYVTRVRREPFARGRDVRWCFETLGVDPPNLSVVAYALKRKEYLAAGEEYASYALTRTGADFVEVRFRLLKRG